MRYYLYISDAKVDMLLPQVPKSSLQKTSVEFGVNIEIFKASYKEEHNHLDSRVARLKAVEDYIVQQHDEVGSLENPSSWVKATTKVKVVDFGEGSVFFVGKKGSIIFGLGGSARNLIGHAPSGTFIKSYSFLPFMIERMLVSLEQDSRKIFIDNLILNNEMKDDLSACVGQGFDAWIEVLENATTLAIPTQKVKFLAKPLAMEESRGVQYILGTPLYVYLE